MPSDLPAAGGAAVVVVPSARATTRRRGPGRRRAGEWRAPAVARRHRAGARPRGTAELGHVGLRVPDLRFRGQRLERTWRRRMPPHPAEWAMSQRRGRFPDFRVVLLPGLPTPAGSFSEHAQWPSGFVAGHSGGGRAGVAPASLSSSPGSMPESTHHDAVAGRGGRRRSKNTPAQADIRRPTAGAAGRRHRADRRHAARLAGSHRSSECGPVGIAPTLGTGPVRPDCVLPVPPPPVAPPPLQTGMPPLPASLGSTNCSTL